jgi:uncharacterized protein (TIGR03382 family)
MSATVASGGGTSVYQHPQGMSCTWTKNITMTRTGSNGSDVPDGSGGIPGPDGGTANSDGGGAGDKDGGGCHLAATPTGAAGLLPLVFLLLALGRRRR